MSKIDLSLKETFRRARDLSTYDATGELPPCHECRFHTRHAF